MELIDHVRKYVREIKYIDEYFKEKYLTTDVLRSVRLKEIPKEGFIDNGKYHFHGIGCKVIYPDRTINFDYSPKGVSGGFGLYDIVEYLRSKGEKIAREEISKELDKLINKGDVLYPKLPPNDALYYLEEHKDLLS